MDRTDREGCGQLWEILHRELQTDQICTHLLQQEVEEGMEVGLQWDLFVEVRVEA